MHELTPTATGRVPEMGNLDESAGGQQHRDEHIDSA